MSVTKHSEHSFQDWFQAIDVAIAAFQRDTPYSEFELTYVNPAFESIIGWTAKDIVGKSLNRLQDDFGWQGFLDAAWPSLDRGAEWQGTTITRRHDGSSFISVWRLKPRVNGERLEYVAVLEDVSSQAEEENAKDSARFIFERMVEVSMDAIIVVNGEQTITSFNPGAERTFGWKAADVLGLPLETLIPKEFQATHRQNVEAFRHGAEATRQMDKRRSILGRRRDGTEFPAEATITKVVVGHSLHFAVILRDISARRQREQALEKSERRFRTLFHESLQFVQLLSPDGSIAEANQSSLTYCGASPEEVRGRQIDECGWMEGLEESAEHMRQAVQEAAKGNLVRGYVDLRGSDGEMKTFDFSIHPIVDKSGHVFNMLFEARDVSELVAANTAIRKSERLLKNAQRIGRMGNWTWDIKTGDLQWSDEIYRIFGMQKEGFSPTYEAFLGRIHPDDRGLVEQAVADALEGLGPYSIDHRIVRPDGEVRFVHEDGAIMFDGTDTPKRMEGVVQDVTSRREARAELEAAMAAAEEANEAKSRFLAVVSHELKTPLNAIIGFSQMLMSQPHGPLGHASYRQYVEDVLGSGKRLSRIVDNILEVTRLDRLSLEASETSVDLAEILEKTVAAFEKGSGNCPVTVRQAADVKLRTDPRLLQEMLIHLVDNGCKFSDPGSPVDILVVARGDNVDIHVSDKGVGIPADQLAHVTDAFYQIDNELNRRFEGLGLGLFLVRQFMNAHGGALHITSKPDEGTTATLSFPADRVAHAPEASCDKRSKENS